METRIKYYPPNDLCHYNYIKNISNFISNTFDKEKTYSDINDIMELYNVIKYIDDKSIPFSSDIKNSLSDFKQIANKKIAMFFNKILTNDNFHENYSKLDVFYHNDFWEILDITPYINSSNTNAISTLILSNDNLFSKILSKPNLVKKFDKVLTKKMLENPNLSTSILLDKFEYNKSNIFIPTSLSEENKQTIINNYIKNACSPELLYLIINFNSNKKTLDIPPTIKLKAKKKIEEIEKDFSHEYKNLFGVSTIIEIKNQQEPVKYTHPSDNHYIFSYSEEFLKKDLNPISILNNFIYLFNFIDLNDRCSLVTHPKQPSIDRIISRFSPNAYINDSLFNINDSISLNTLHLYYNFLLHYNIRLENIIEYFFNTYIKNTFSIDGFQIDMPSANSTMLEKCSSIMPAIEGILKQFQSFIEYNIINSELLDFNSKQLRYATIPSLLKKKYIYVHNSIMNDILNYLCSEQTTLNHKKNSNKLHKNLFEFLFNEDVFYYDFEDFNLPMIDYLIKYDILSLNQSTQQITFNAIKLAILKDLYYNEYISYWYLSTKEKHIIDEFINKGFLCSKSTLLSKPESDYFNFYLNNVKFNNGFKLRNKYAHKQPFSNDKQIHYVNYFRFLRLAIIITLKIHDELITYTDYYTEPTNHKSK